MDNQLAGPDRRTHELTVINEIAQALNGSIDLNQALQSTLAHVADLLGLRTGWIWLLNDETGASYLAAEQNLPPALANNPARMEGSCYCLDSYRKGDMTGAANINVVSCSRLKNLLEETDGLTYHASVPLYAHGKQIGVLNVASKDWRELSADDLRLLHTVGDMLGIAVERARLFERSQELGAVSERNRLAREIHDTLAQGFAAIALQLQTADALLEIDELSAATREKIRQTVQRATKTAQDNLEEARRSVTDLRATPLEGRTLAEALQELTATLSEETQLEIQFASSGDNVPLPIAVETGLFRIAHEALTNIRNHSQATDVKLDLTTAPDSVTLSVTDNGQGFSPEAVDDNRFGVLGMSERAKLLGGKFRLNSAPGQGTTILVQIPIRTMTDEV